MPEGKRNRLSDDKKTPCDSPSQLSCRVSAVTIWEKISKKHDISFYYTGEKGAFILKNKSF